jgi:quinol monooxygenase YgiN
VQQLPDTPVHVVTALESCPDEAARFLQLMRTDYEFIAKAPGFRSATLLASRIAAGTYFHVTEWESVSALATVVEHPIVREVFASLPLVAPPRSHQCDARIAATPGWVAVQGA